MRRIALCILLALISFSVFSQNSLMWFRAISMNIAQNEKWDTPVNTNIKISVNLEKDAFFEGTIMVYNEKVEVYSLTEYLGRKQTREGETYSWTFINESGIKGLCRFFINNNETYVLTILLPDRGFGVAYQMISID